MKIKVVEIESEIKLKRSDSLWHFACGDVLIFTQSTECLNTVNAIYVVASDTGEWQCREWH